MHSLDPIKEETLFDLFEASCVVASDEEVEETEKSWDSIGDINTISFPFPLFPLFDCNAATVPVFFDHDIDHDGSHEGVATPHQSSRGLKRAKGQSDLSPLRPKDKRRRRRRLISDITNGKHSDGGRDTIDYDRDHDSVMVLGHNNFKKRKAHQQHPNHYNGQHHHNQLMLLAQHQQQQQQQQQQHQVVPSEDCGFLFRPIEPQHHEEQHKHLHQLPLQQHHQQQQQQHHQQQQQQHQQQQQQQQHQQQQHHHQLQHQFQRVHSPHPQYQHQLQQQGFPFHHDQFSV